MTDLRTGEVDAVAIVGLACRVPGAADPGAFWRLLRAGRDAVGAVPDGSPHRSRWAPGRVPRPRRRVRPGVLRHLPARGRCHGPAAAARAGTGLGGAGGRRDPARATSRGSRTGVFVGAIWDDYASLLHRRGATRRPSTPCTGLHRSIIANRVSYVLGLRGPSIDRRHRPVVRRWSPSTWPARACAAASATLGARRRGQPQPGRGEHRGRGRGVRRAVPGRPLLHLRRARQRLRPRRGRRRRRAQAARPTPSPTATACYCVIRGSAVNNDGGGDGLTAPSIDGAGGRAARRRTRTAGVDPRRRPVRRAARHRHPASATRSRPPRSAPCSAPAARPTAAAGRLGEDQHRPPRRRRRHRRPDQDRARASQHGELPPSLNFATPNPRHPARRAGPARCSELDACPAWPRRPAGRRRQLVRHGRHQLPRRAVRHATGRIRR